ncbi:MAG: DUF3037 domain-containing protein [Chitinophagaceae bacterium]|nr:DUF3037 domain-containing protein [Chitinophagaceae bacterium]
MATNYSIVFITPNAAIQERIAVGLLLISKNEHFFKYSNERLSLARHLLGKDQFKLVTESFKSLERTLAKQLEEESSYRNALLIPQTKIDFTVQYIGYLSNYKNNLVSYSAPLKIALEPTVENFERLFHRLIANPVQVENSTRAHHYTPIEQLKEKYYTQVVKHFSLDQTISYNKVDKLIVPVKVDLAGRNEIDVYVQSIDMEAKPDSIIKEISTFYMLKDAYRANKIPMKEFVLAEEPPKEMKKQHDLWQHLYNSTQFDYVDTSESQKIIEYAEKHDVLPVAIEEEDPF